MMRYLYIILFCAAFVACKSNKYPNLENGVYADVQTSKGDILLKLYSEKTPMTVANFVSLAEGTNTKVSDSLKGDKYYNGMVFHRVIKDFMIQGGDPLANGTGGPGYTFGDEFPRDSTGALIFKHDAAGVLSMANPGPPNTNGSQFFITHKSTPWLDGRHTVFGKVEIGQGIVDAMEKDDEIKNIDIIRVGKKAKKFNGGEVFDTEVLKFQEAEKERVAALEKQKIAFQKKMDIDKAIETESGLKVIHLKKGTGKSVRTDKETTVYYTLYTAYGELIQSNIGKSPFKFTIDKIGLITGWKEGVMMMKEGGKTRLFIPSYLGYGENGNGPIKPNTDLVFEIEVVKVAK